MAWYNWSQTPAANATADVTINWQEGQAPSSINDSARAMMAASAKYRDDIAGAILTSGTATAYNFNSYSVYDTLAHLNGQMLAFTPHTTNAAVVTLNVDGLGARPLRSAPGAELLAGTIIQGTPYVATYNNSDGAFYLQGFFGNPYTIPLGGGIDYWLPTTPNSSFVFPFGQAISRSTYATLFSGMGTTYGNGDGSTTFNIPDLRGRVALCADNMGGAQANRVSSVIANGLGAAAGEAQHALSIAEMPSHYHSAAIYDPGHAHSVSHNAVSLVGAVGTGGGAFNYCPTQGASITVNGAGTGVRVNSSNGLDTTYSNGGNGAHNNLQPSIVCNYIMRIV